MPQIHIEKLIFGGQALGRLDGKTIFVWNALPGEDVEIEYISNKKNFAEAIATKIINPSPNRIKPKEAHYLATSPWDIMDYKTENEWKKQVAIETYGRNGGLILQENPPTIEFDDQQYGYRNKIEFNFTKLQSNQISLAFLNRNSHIYIPVENSSLAKPELNLIAKKILNWINENRFPFRSLQTITIKSNQKGQVIAALFINNKINFTNFPALNDQFIGFVVYCNSQIIHNEGQNYLEDKILGLPLAYGINSFFQVNVPMFEKALKDIAAFTDPKTELIDYYSGVGAISLPISKNRARSTLIDNNMEAIDFAKYNIKENQLLNCDAICTSSENMTKLIARDKLIILDPPRAGLDPKVTARLLASLPPRIIYLSCDLSTQARDIGHLSEHYKVAFLKLYNFFPRTPHIEGLCVLDRVSF